MYLFCFIGQILSFKNQDWIKKQIKTHISKQNVWFYLHFFFFFLWGGIWKWFLKCAKSDHHPLNLHTQGTKCSVCPCTCPSNIRPSSKKSLYWGPYVQKSENGGTLVIFNMLKYIFMTSIILASVSSIFESFFSVLGIIFFLHFGVNLWFIFHFIYKYIKNNHISKYFITVYG